MAVTWVGLGAVLVAAASKGGARSVFGVAVTGGVSGLMVATVGVLATGVLGVGLSIGVESASSGEVFAEEFATISIASCPCFSSA